MASSQHHELYRDHSRNWQQNRYAYAVLSRRSRGLSIGINLNPDKACNFDCVYCSVDRSVPGGDRRIDLPRLESELNGLLDLAVKGGIFQNPPFDCVPEPLRRVNDVAFSGDGEPTACGQFPAAVSLALQAVRPYPSVRLILITNATLLGRPTVAAAVDQMATHASEVWAKLDAGTRDYYQLVDRTSVPLQVVLDNIAALGRRRPVVIQSMFVRWQNQPPCERELDAWQRRLVELLSAGCRIDRVQVYTIARPAAEADAGPVGPETLESAARRARSLGLIVEPFVPESS